MGGTEAVAEEVAEAIVLLRLEVGMAKKPAPVDIHG